VSEFGLYQFTVNVGLVDEITAAAGGSGSLLVGLATRKIAGIAELGGSIAWDTSSSKRSILM